MAAQYWPIKSSSGQVRVVSFDNRLVVGAATLFPVGEEMAIYRLLQQASWDQADIDRMTAAYEAALRVLRLSDRTDPLTEMIAKKIIEVTRSGEQDPANICARTLKELGAASPE